jgi:hypothetical protein
MKIGEHEVPNRPRQRPGVGRQPLVVRHAEENDQMDGVLERLARLETTAEPSVGTREPADERRLARLDARTIAAVAAILLSIAGYVIQDARNTSRQDAEIESAKARLVNLERIAATNTEARVRSEVELEELRQGQAEIKDLLRAHENETKAILHQK